MIDQVQWLQWSRKFLSSSSKEKIQRIVSTVKTKQSPRVSMSVSCSITLRRTRQSTKICNTKAPHGVRKKKTLSGFCVTPNLQHQDTTWSSKEENAFGFLCDDMAFVLRAFMTHTKTPFPNSLRISRLCASLRLFVLCNPCQFLGLVL